MVDTPYIGQPAWGQDAIDAWNDLQQQILDFIAGVDFAGGLARSTDGSFGLSLPTGSGFEFVIENNLLEDIQFDGASL